MRQYVRNNSDDNSLLLAMARQSVAWDPEHLTPVTMAIFCGFSRYMLIEASREKGCNALSKR